MNKSNVPKYLTEWTPLILYPCFVLSYINSVFSVVLLRLTGSCCSPNITTILILFWAIIHFIMWKQMFSYRRFTKWLVIPSKYTYILHKQMYISYLISFLLSLYFQMNDIFECPVTHGMYAIQGPYHKNSLLCSMYNVHAQHCSFC